MSWSISSNGTKAQVLANLRQQMHSSDHQYGQPHPVGMSDQENTLRRAAQTLLYQAVLAHNIDDDSKSKTHVGTMKWISAAAWGSEVRDAETGESYQDIGIQVMCSARTE